MGFSFKDDSSSGYNPGILLESKPMTEMIPPRGEDYVPKLTSWEKEPLLTDLKNDLQAADQAHKAQVSKIQHWNDLTQVKGSAKPKKVKGRSAVQPKLIRRQNEWRYPALSEPFLSSDKLFRCAPVTFEDGPAARQNELLLNHQFRTRLKPVNLINTLVRTVVDEGTAVLQTGWNRVTRMVTEQVPVYEFYQVETEEQLQVLDQAMQLSSADPRTYNENVPDEVKEAVTYYEETGMPVYALVSGYQEQEVEKVLMNHPTVTVHNPENVIIDPSCQGDIDKAMFAIVSFETCKADLLKNPDRYKNLDYVNWEGAAPVTNPDHATTTPTDFNINDPLRKRVVAYEYWGFHDIHDEGVLTPIVATWIGNVMIRCEENPFPDNKLPFTVITYLPVKRELYGEPDAALLEDNQTIQGAVMRGMIDLLGRSANSQQGIPKGMLDPLNRRRFDNGQDYEYNPPSNPNIGLVTHKYPELPQSAMIMLGLQDQQAEALTGVKAFSGGVSGEAYGDVAAGIRGALDAASKREMDILRRLAAGVTGVAVKIAAMNAVFLSKEEVVRVTNDEFVTIKREDLEGNFDWTTDISTAEVDQAKAEDLAFMLQTLGPKGDQQMVLMILSEIAELKRMPELAERLRRFRPQPTPEEQRMAELAIEKAELENEELRSQIRLNEAKAQETLANKDKKNLDFVEQETGTTHERDMQKQQAQAQGNQDLQVTKALLTPQKEGERAPNIEAGIGYNELSRNNSSSSAAPVGSTIARDGLAPIDPALNLASGQFDPSRDPALNPAINI